MVYSTGKITEVHTNCLTLIVYLADFFNREDNATSNRVLFVMVRFFCVLERNRYRGN